MSKRQQTTGSARRRQPTDSGMPAQVPWFDRLLGNPRTSKERETAINQLLVRSTIAIAVFVISIIAIGFINDQVITPNQTVVSVGDEQVTVAEFRDRVRFEYGETAYNYQQFINQLRNSGFDDQNIGNFLQREPYATWANELRFPDLLGQRVIEDMTTEALARQQATELDITVDDDAVDREIDEFFGYDPTAVASLGEDPTATVVPTETATPIVSPTASPTPAPTGTPANEATQTAVNITPTASLTPLASLTPDADTIRENYLNARENYQSNIVSFGGASTAALDDFYRRLALENAVTDYLVGDTTEEVFVDSRHILVATEAEANSVIESLNQGVPFSDLARQLSIDTGSGQNGGELGEAPASNYVGPFRDAVIEAPTGEIYGPVESEFGYHIIQVRSRETREASEQELETARRSAYQSWADNLRTENEDEISVNDSWINYMPVIAPVLQ